MRRDEAREERAVQRMLTRWSDEAVLSALAVAVRSGRRDRAELLDAEVSRRIAARRAAERAARVEGRAGG